MKKDIRFGIEKTNLGYSWAQGAKSASITDFRVQKGTNPPSGKDLVTLLLPSSETLLKVERIPSTDPEEIAMIATNQMEGDAPLSPDEMVFAHEILHTDGQNSLVLEASAPLSAVDSLRAELKLDPAQIERVDVSILGLARALANHPEFLSSARTPVLVDENSKLILLVMEARRPVFSRVLGSFSTIKPKLISRAIHLALLQLELDLPPFETSSETSSPADTAKLLLISGSEENHRILSEIAVLLQKDELFIDSSSLLSAVAGAIQRTHEKSSLNLFPLAWEQKLDDRRYKQRFLGGVALAFLVWLVGALWLYGWPLLLAAQKATLEKEVESRKAGEQMVNEIRDRIRIIDRYSDRTFSPLEILLHISMAVPEGVQITAFRFDAARREASVEATCANSGLAYEFSNRLKAYPILARNSFVVGPTEHRNTHKVTFTLQIAFTEAENVTPLAQTLSSDTNSAAKEGK